MVRMINALTGTTMYVPEDRQEEYLLAGHKLPEASEEKAAPEADRKPVRKIRKR